MLRWIWARGCHPLVDFGREAYLAWQLSEGRILYVDINHLHGPFSPYANALAFKGLFGPSIACMAIANAVILACLLALLGYTSSAVCSRPTTFLCLLFFVAVFGFADCGDWNMNYIYPYSTEATMGRHSLLPPSRLSGGGSSEDKSRFWQRPAFVSAQCFLARPSCSWHLPLRRWRA